MITIYKGDVLQSLRQLPSDSVHSAITSPPYYGLRDYAILPSIWGGDKTCKHKWISNGKRGGGSAKQGKTGQMRSRAVVEARTNAETLMGHTCTKCGAWKGTLGLEPTIEMHVRNIVEVFRELRRVLRPDGTLWMNYGDTYSTAPAGRTAAETKEIGKDNRTFRDKPVGTTQQLAPKQRMGMPERIVLALQADGWWWRDEIIWHKPNPMPISVKDRTTPAHEKLYLLTKKPRYFFDQFAIKETSAEASLRRYAQPTVDSQEGGTKADAYESRIPNPKLRSRRPNEIIQALAASGADPMKNKRSVWTIPTEPFADAHFATFPTDLVRQCIAAGTSSHGACPKCGKPWERLTKKTHTNPGNRTTNGPRSTERKHEDFGSAGYDQRLEVAEVTIGFRPTCRHYEDQYNELPRPKRARKREQRDAYDARWKRVLKRPGDQYWSVDKCTVLDPFLGSGTTALVADQMQRAAIGIEIKPEYAEMAAWRCKTTFTQVTLIEVEDADIRAVQKLARPNSNSVRVRPKTSGRRNKNQAKSVQPTKTADQHEKRKRNPRGKAKVRRHR